MNLIPAFIFPFIGAGVILFSCLYHAICYFCCEPRQRIVVNPSNDLEGRHRRHEWRNPVVNDYPLALPTVSAPRTTVQAVANVVAYDGQGKTKFANDECVICLAGFENGEVCQVLENCEHVYHRECIDKWMSRNLRCPICRAPICRARAAVRISNLS